MADPQLDQVLNTPLQAVLSTGDAVAVSAITVAELPAFIDAIAPLLSDGYDIDPAKLIISHPRELIEAVRVGARMDAGQVNALGIDDLVELAVVIIEVNADFFVHRILPRLTGRMASLEKTLTGLSSSISSCRPATPSPT
jgi:hypothetical protein